MVAIKLEVTDRPTLRWLDVGDQLFGWRVLATVPDGVHYIVEVPEEELDRLPRLRAQDQIVDWRPAHTYAVTLLPGSVRPLAGEQVGDTFPLIGAVEAVRARGQYGAGVIIGACDTGADFQHQAFRGKTLYGDTTDSHGHGTHVLSTAGSAWGIASDAALWMRNVLPGGQGTEAGVANGIREAGDVAARQRVPMALNLSLGGGTSQVIDQAVQYARGRGVVVVAAAGNDPGAAIGSPARAADLIVLACDRQRQLASFTAGRTWRQPNRVVAPGVNIAAAKAGSGDGVLVASGTSMATPHVTGAVALLLAAGLTPHEIRGILATGGTAPCAPSTTC